MEMPAWRSKHYHLRKPHDATVRIAIRIANVEVVGLCSLDLASLTSSIMDYEFENGRRYHAFKAGCQWLSPPFDLVAIFAYSVQAILYLMMRFVTYRCDTGSFDD